MVVRKAFWLVLAMALLALPVCADDIILRGIDLWTTTNDGSTFVEFAHQPIPAGFFCSQSQPFTGRIALRGVSVATARSGELGSTDTIVERLDDAAFNKKGVASTRIQVRALQLESITPFKTACGSFNIRVRLDGGQPITRMQIVRENKRGGHMQAALGIRSKLSFSQRESSSLHFLFMGNLRETRGKRAGAAAANRGFSARVPSPSSWKVRPLTRAGQSA